MNAANEWMPINDVWPSCGYHHLCDNAKWNAPKVLYRMNNGQWMGRFGIPPTHAATLNERLADVQEVR